MGKAAYGWNANSDNPLSPSNIITGVATEAAYDRLYAADKQVAVQFGTRNTMRLSGFTGTMTNVQPNGLFTFVTTRAPAFSGPATHDFVNVGHGLWALLLAACGGMFAWLLFVTRQSPEKGHEQSSDR